MTAVDTLGETSAYVGLGSNLGNSIDRVCRGRLGLAQLPGTRLLAFSSLYRSAPMGPPGQDPYINAVAALATRLGPQELLRQLHRLEAAHGRTRDGVRWGPRTLDLDLLLYGDRVIETAGLRVPHPGLGQRSFVLYPLSELAPELRIPGRGMVRELARRCGTVGLERLAGSC